MMPALPRRALVAGGLAGALARRAVAEEPGLAALAAARGVALGSMVCEYQLRETPALWPLLRREAGFIVPGLELKWAASEPEPGRFAFTDAEALLARAAEAGMTVHGHALVWHEALPPWLDARLDAAAMRQVLQRHIAGVAGHFAGRLAVWDVVNEPVAPHERQPRGLRDTPFLRAMGADYIPLALEWAAEADPAARLRINEFDLELRNRYQQDRREAMLELLNTLVRRRAPLHALGIQAHLRLREASWDAGLLRRFIRDVASLGLEVHITELDIIDRLAPADPAARDAEATATLREFLSAVLAEPAVTTIALWGLTDRYAWASDNSFARRRDGLPSRAHPYDTDLRPKPDRAAIAAALRDAPRPG
jgi:endo-1,4-beta-xylanase